MFIVVAILDSRNSFELRNYLRKNGFKIYLRRKITGQREAFHEIGAENETLLFYDQKTIEFECIYNSPDKFPSQTTLRQLGESPKVKNFYIERRSYD